MPPLLEGGGGYTVLPLSVCLAFFSATIDGRNLIFRSMCIKINKVGKQEIGIRWVQKRFPRYGVPIWSLWPNMIWSQASYRYLISWEAFLNPSDSYFLFADFVDFYTHLTYICICTFVVAFFSATVGIRWVQKRFPRYGVPLWSLWPNIRFLPSIVAEKNVTKNVDGRDPSDSYFLFAEERGYHKWALAHSSSCFILCFHHWKLFRVIPLFKLN
jgi:hypothetical protein